MRNFFRRLRDSFRKPKFSNRQKTKMRSGAAKGAMRRKGMKERTGLMQSRQILLVILILVKEILIIRHDYLTARKHHKKH